MYHYVLAFFLVSTYSRGLGVYSRPSKDFVPLSLSSLLTSLANECPKEKEQLVERIQSQGDFCNVYIPPLQESQFECMMFYDINKQLCSSSLNLPTNFSSRLSEKITTDAICDHAQNWIVKGYEELPIYKDSLEKVFKTKYACIKLCGEVDILSQDANFFCKYYKLGMELLNTFQNVPSSTNNNFSDLNAKTEKNENSSPKLDLLPDQTHKLASKQKEADKMSDENYNKLLNSLVKDKKYDIQTSEQGSQRFLNDQKLSPLGQHLLPEENSSVGHQVLSAVPQISAVDNLSAPNEEVRLAGLLFQPALKQPESVSQKLASVHPLPPSRQPVAPADQHSTSARPNMAPAAHADQNAPEAQKTSPSLGEKLGAPNSDDDNPSDFVPNVNEDEYSQEDREEVVDEPLKEKKKILESDSSRDKNATDEAQKPVPPPQSQKPSPSPSSQPVDPSDLDLKSYINPSVENYINPSEEDHFFSFFLTCVVMTVLLYVLYHNKSKVSKWVLGFLVEGRQSGRRRNSRSHAYKRLDTLEHAMSSGSSAPPSKIIY